MRLLAPATLLPVVALAITSGCGSSRTRPVGSHSATSHYTVKQVETAFAAQGVRLHRIDAPKSFGLVILRRPSESPFIEALVRTPGTRPPDRVVLNGGTLSFRTRTHRNVTVLYALSTAPTVKAALAGLH
jgi:uncharacterized protein YceK